MCVKCMCVHACVVLGVCQLCVHVWMCGHMYTFLLQLCLSSCSSLAPLTRQSTSLYPDAHRLPQKRISSYLARLVCWAAFPKSARPDD